MFLKQVRERLFRGGKSAWTTLLRYGVCRIYFEGKVFVPRSVEWSSGGDDNFKGEMEEMSRFG